MTIPAIGWYGNSGNDHNADDAQWHSLQSDGDNSGNGFLYSQIIAYPDYLSLAQLYLIYHTHQCALQHIGGYDMYSLVSFSMYPEESCATMGALNCPVMEHEKILSQFGEIWWHYPSIQAAQENPYICD